MISFLADINFKIYSPIISSMKSSQAHRNSINLGNKCQILNGYGNSYV